MGPEICMLYEAPGLARSLLAVARSTFRFNQRLHRGKSLRNVMSYTVRGKV